MGDAELRTTPRLRLVGKQRPPLPGVKCRAQQVQNFQLYSMEEFAKKLAQYFTFSDLIQWETTCKSVRNSVCKCLCWKSACASETNYAIRAADEIVSGFMVSVASFKEMLDAEISSQLASLQETRHKRHLFGYWGLPSDQLTFPTLSYVVTDVSPLYIRFYTGMMTENNDYTRLHEVVTHRLGALRAELRRLALINQGKPLLARCLQSMSGKAFRFECLQIELSDIYAVQYFSVIRATVQSFAVRRCQILDVEVVMKNLSPDEEVFTEYWFRQKKKRPSVEICRRLDILDAYRAPKPSLLIAECRGWWIEAYERASEAEESWTDRDIQNEDSSPEFDPDFA